MKESNIQTIFGKQIINIVNKLSEIYKTNKNFAFELKFEQSNSIAFDRIKEHQYENLKKVEHGFYYKISDSPIFGENKTRFTAPKPFDCFYTQELHGFVVICWYEERKRKECHFINVYELERERGIATRKSLTYERSKEISTMIYDLNVKNQ